MAKIKIQRIGVKGEMLYDSHVGVIKHASLLLTANREKNRPPVVGTVVQ